MKMVTQKDPTKGSKPGSWARRGAGCLTAVILAPLIYYGLYFLLRGPLPSNPQVIAHRGGPAAYGPENTLRAFRNAVDGGIDWLEFDVQRTQDGVLVVIHDETLERTTNGSGNVKDLTFEQIRALDAGDGEQVPSFEEVIALAKSAGVGILPEAKSPDLYPGIEAEIAEALTAQGYIEPSIVQSFEPRALESLEQINPEITVCPLYGLWALDISNPRPQGAQFLCLMAEMVLINPWMIRGAHADGRKVYVWFGIIEHPLVMRLLLALGADGLMVDDPPALAEILGR